MVNEFYFYEMLANKIFGIKVRLNAKTVYNGFDFKYTIEKKYYRKIIKYLNLCKIIDN